MTLDNYTRDPADRIMAAMTDDCVFETGGGEAAWGDRYEGAAAVRDVGGATPLLERLASAVSQAVKSVPPPAESLAPK